MGRFFGKIKKKARRLTEKMDQYQEAITFAEAGQQEHVQGLIQAKKVEEKPRKLLVIGRESTFSREVIDYAIEMAQRMSYEILALNTAPLSCETFKLFSSSRKKLCQEFQDISQKNVRAFQEEAEKKAIPFAHVVKFSEPDEALEEMKREYEDIEFVVSEAEEERVANRAEDGERLRSEIFVYHMV
ncbi:MAG: hypothetical protein JRJ42_04780 [Deltaproteobacteria bacterium]|nr:hypothetical protein [Deltaproteobacteria bacterium]MBW2073765.1 hypothetical protein [Deltaproteobacteria bacterium]RLB81707.1 MAG: hypothetical protein DRH17_08125 [Deltaproteobacteria bacterium]